jgi:hypothetical protein
MSHTTSTHDALQADPIEALVHTIPVVIPAVGALLIFLLAFIAITMG